MGDYYQTAPDKYADLLDKIMTDPRYHAGLAYGVPRKGHPEGTVKNHMTDLQCNLVALRMAGVVDVGSEWYWKLMVLIHVHDIMKHCAKHDSAISDPQSHASLARKFLSEFSDDTDLQNIVQAHDENLALWQQNKARGIYKEERLKERVVDKIVDVDLLLLFQLIDGYTPGKTDMREMLRWFVEQVAKYRPVGDKVYQALEVFKL